MRLYHQFLGVALGATTVVLGLAAHASEPLAVEVSGRARAFVFARDQDQSPAENLKSVNAFANAAAYFDSAKTLDNGIRLSGVLELNSTAKNLFSGGTRNQFGADRIYVDAVTAVGKFRVGKREGVNSSIIEDAAPEAFLTPTEEIIGDVLKARTGITTRDALTFKRFADHAFGVTYETPAFLPGLKFGLSFHPSTGTDSRTINRTTSARNGVDVSGRYEGRYSAGTYRIAAGYFQSDSRAALKNATKAWNTNAQVTYGGWELAATYLASTPASGKDDTAWSIGALYGIGPYKISATYLASRREPIPGAVLREQAQRATLQGNYRIRTGVNVGLAGFYAVQRDAAQQSWDGLGLLTGVKLAF